MSSFSFVPTLFPGTLLCKGVGCQAISFHRLLCNRYRFAEIHYLRSEGTHKGRQLPTRVETVVLFLPDIWTCSPTRLEWGTVKAAYAKQLHRKIAAIENKDEPLQALTKFLFCFLFLQRNDEQKYHSGRLFYCAITVSCFSSGFVFPVFERTFPCNSMPVQKNQC